MITLCKVVVLCCVSFVIQRYLISYEFNDGEDQEKGGDMLVKWYETGGVENRPDTYEVQSCVFMIHNGTGHCVVRADYLNTIWKPWHPWRKLMDISIQPCLDMEETISLIKKN